MKAFDFVFSKRVFKLDKLKIQYIMLKPSYATGWQYQQNCIIFLLLLLIFMQQHNCGASIQVMIPPTTSPGLACIKLRNSVV